MEKAGAAEKTAEKIDEHLQTTEECDRIECYSFGEATEKVESAKNDEEGWLTSIGGLPSAYEFQSSSSMYEPHSSFFVLVPFIP
jgi:hypothetical protein